MMNCNVCQNEMPELVLDHGTPSAEMSAHLAACTSCREEYDSLMATFHLLDEWKAPEPSAFFDQRLAAHLRAEIAAPPAGFFARLRDRVLFGSSLQLRPAMAGVMALVLIVGGGSVAGVHYLGATNLGAMNSPLAANAPAASATVNDLVTLDKNEQALEQLDQLLSDDADASSADQPSI